MNVHVVPEFQLSTFNRFFFFTFSILICTELDHGSMRPPRSVPIVIVSVFSVGTEENLSQRKLHPVCFKDEERL